MYYQGESNVPGAPGNLAQGIPVGQDPRFPMPQEVFHQYVDERRPPKLLAPYGGSMLEMIRQTQGRSPQAQLAPGVAPMGNAGFFYGPQLGQGVPPGYQSKTVS